MEEYKKNLKPVEAYLIDIDLEVVESEITSVFYSNKPGYIDRLERQPFIQINKKELKNIISLSSWPNKLEKLSSVEINKLEEKLLSYINYFNKFKVYKGKVYMGIMGKLFSGLELLEFYKFKK